DSSSELRLSPTRTARRTLCAGRFWRFRAGQKTHTWEVRYSARVNRETVSHCELPGCPMTHSTIERSPQSGVEITDHHREPRDPTDTTGLLERLQAPYDSNDHWFCSWAHAAD